MLCTKCATYYTKGTITPPWTWTYSLTAGRKELHPSTHTLSLSTQSITTTAQIELQITTHTSPPVSLHWEVKEYTNRHAKNGTWAEWNVHQLDGRDKNLTPAFSTLRLSHISVIMIKWHTMAMLSSKWLCRRSFKILSSLKQNKKKPIWQWSGLTGVLPGHVL